MSGSSKQAAAAPNNSGNGVNGKLTPKPAAGEKAPEFELPDDSGGRVSLASFAGKKLALYFYPKDDTSGCTKEALDFNALREEFAKAGTAILGISPDETKATLQAYGVWAEKSMYGRKYMGVERTTFLIKDGTVAQVWRKVKVPGHAAAVLAAAKAL